MRLAASVVSGWRSGRIGALDESRTVHRAWLGDCDPNFHVNEGRYLLIAGLARITLWVRMGLFRSIFREGLRPAAISTTAYYHREIPPFARFEIASRLIWWDERYMYFEHRFERAGREAARVVVRSVFSGGGRILRPAEVLARLGHTGDAPPPTPELEHWARMREAAKAAAHAT